MARSLNFLLFAAAIIATASFHSAASSPAPAPSPDCLTPLLNMSDCLSYVSEGSNDTTPDKHCCPELAGLIQSSPTCLCQLLSDPQKSGFKIDVKRALNLPSACKLNTPSVSLCSLLGFPVGEAPEGAPGSAPSTFPSGVPAPDSGRSPNTPGYGSKMECSHLGFLIGLALVFL